EGLTLGSVMHPSIATAKRPVATLAAADQYTFAPAGLAAHPLEASILQEAANIGAAHATSPDPGLSTAGKIAYDSHHLYYGLGSIRNGFNSPVAYPTSSDPFPHRLAGLAAMLAAGLPVSVVGLTVGHFDTHAGQTGILQRDLQLGSDSLLAFQRDLEARGIADRVITHVWSAFGRRDASGNLKPTADFRAVYAALLEQWFNADSNAILPGVAGFARPALLK